jgi:hypothetical protein
MRFRLRPEIKETLSEGSAEALTFPLLAKITLKLFFEAFSWKKIL